MCKGSVSTWYCRVSLQILSFLLYYRLQSNSNYWILPEFISCLSLMALSKLEIIWTLPTLPINSFLQKIFQSLRKPVGAKGCTLMSSNTLMLNCAELLSIHKHLHACHWSGKCYSDQVFDTQCLYHALSIHWWTCHVKDEICDQIKVITKSLKFLSGMILLWFVVLVW